MVVLLYVSVYLCLRCVSVCFLFQAEDGIRDLVRSRGLGDVYKRQVPPGLVPGVKSCITDQDAPGGRLAHAGERMSA